MNKNIMNKEKLINSLENKVIKHGLSTLCFPDKNRWTTLGDVVRARAILSIESGTEEIRVSFDTNTYVTSILRVISTEKDPLNAVCSCLDKLNKLHGLKQRVLEHLPIWIKRIKALLKAYYPDRGFKADVEEDAAELWVAVDAGIEHKLVFYLIIAEDAYSGSLSFPLNKDGRLTKKTMTMFRKYIEENS